MELHEKLFQLRKKNGLTQQELAEKLKVSRQAISRWEMNSSLPSTENLISISRIYGINIDYLIDEDQGDIVDKKMKKNTKRNSIFNYVYLIMLVVLIGGLCMFLFTDIFEHLVVSFWFIFLTLSLFALVIGLVHTHMKKREQ